MFKSIREYVDELVHPSVHQDALTASRHRSFIAPRLLGSLVALTSFPLYLAARGAPTALEVLVFAWLIAPILTAYFLSRTGRYESAHVLSSLALTGLITIVAAKTGGITSFAAIWLVVVPLEAALSASRRVVSVASTLALAAAGLLLTCESIHLLPPAEQGTGALAALGIISAALYATGLALGAESLARTSFWLLYAEEDRYRLLARNMSDVITRHGPGGAVLFASPAAEALFSVATTQLQGHGLFDRVHVADRPAYLTALAEAAACAVASSVEFRVRRDRTVAEQPSAEFIWIEMRCRPLDGAFSEASGSDQREVVAVMRDVTERKAQEHALEVAREEAERANTAKSRFLATMSHELRTPLNAIIGFSEMMMNETQMRLDFEKRREYSTLINGSGHHLLQVVNEILDMSKLDTGDFELHPEPFVLAPVVTQCCDMLALKAKDNGVALTFKAADDLPEIVADKRALKQILINLISNAVKFTDQGGMVAVTVRAEGPNVAFTVKDSGIGVREEDLPRLGDPFFQARGSYDRKHDGTGLGLSIVKGLIALHRGTFDIQSRVGEGTQIVVRLPLDCEQARVAHVSAKVVDNVMMLGSKAQATAAVGDHKTAVKKSA